MSGTGMPGMMTTPDAVVSLFPMILAGASFALVGWCGVLHCCNLCILHLQGYLMPSLGLTTALSNAGVYARHGHAGYVHPPHPHTGYGHHGHNKADYRKYYLPGITVG